jgi:hypothetical protein
MRYRRYLFTYTFETIDAYKLAEATGVIGELE